MSARIEGLAETKGALAALAPLVQDEVRAHIAKAARNIKASAVQRAPIDPDDGGDLKASIDVRFSAGGMNAEIGSRGLPYAAFVEFGTNDTRAQPYLFPAFLENVRVLRKDLRGTLKAAGQKLRSRVKRSAKTR